MKVVSFNINGLRARLHQLKALIDKHEPDFIGLQETKVHDEMFPIKAIEELGYNVYYHGGKAHYGVALMSKIKANYIKKGFITDDDSSQRRLIEGEFTVNNKKISIINGYFPQGESIDHPVKFPNKIKFYKDLTSHLQTFAKDSNLILMGDINISPTDKDIGLDIVKGDDANKKRWLKTGKCSFQPIERTMLKDLESWGLFDSFRKIHKDVNNRFSWFDYRSRGFDDNRGLRIDVIYTSKSILDFVIDADIDYELRAIEKPSDHAPIYTTFNIN